MFGPSYSAKWRRESLARPARSTEIRYRNPFKHFVARHPGAMLGQLSELVRSDRGTIGRATWNLTRAALLGLLNSVVGRRDPLYLDLKDVKPWPKKALKQRRGNPQTPDQIRALALSMPEYAGTIWGLCLTGMRRGEYWGSWDVLPDRIAVHGTKSPAAERSIPLIFPVERPRRDYYRFAHALHRKTKGALRCHDFRKTYMTWLDDVGIQRTRRQIYLGHEIGDVSELYERKDVTRTWRRTPSGCGCGSASLPRPVCRW